MSLTDDEREEAEERARETPSESAYINALADARGALEALETAVKSAAKAARTASQACSAVHELIESSFPDYAAPEAEQRYFLELLPWARKPPAPPKVVDKALSAALDECPTDVDPTAESAKEALSGLAKTEAKLRTAGVIS